MVVCSLERRKFGWIFILCLIIASHLQLLNSTLKMNNGAIKLRTTLWIKKEPGPRADYGRLCGAQSSQNAVPKKWVRWHPRGWGATLSPEGNKQSVLCEGTMQWAKPVQALYFMCMCLWAAPAVVFIFIASMCWLLTDVFYSAVDSFRSLAIWPMQIKACCNVIVYILSFKWLILVRLCRKKRLLCICIFTSSSLMYV